MKKHLLLIISTLVAVSAFAQNSHAVTATTSSLSVSTARQFDPATSITVTGTNIDNNAVVNFREGTTNTYYRYTGTVSGGTSIAITIPAGGNTVSPLNKGATYTVTVSNPGDVPSNGQTFTVSSWDYTMLSGATGHWRLDQASTVGTNPVKVSSVTDQVNGNNASQSTSANQFTFNAADPLFGNRATMTGDGIGTNMTSSVTMQTLFGSTTVYALWVGAPTAFTAGKFAYQCAAAYSDGTNGYSNISFGQQNVTHATQVIAYNWDGGPDVPIQTAQTITPGTPIIVRSSLSSSRMRVRVGLAAETVGAVTSGAMQVRTNTLMLGATVHSFAGTWAMLFTSSTVPSAADEDSAIRSLQYYFQISS